VLEPAFPARPGQRALSPDLLPRCDGEPVQLPVEDGYLYNGEVEDMHDAILDGKPAYLSLAETRDHVRTLLALYQSARQRARSMSL
jgi:predicted dehydrogenase